MGDVITGVIVGHEQDASKVRGVGLGNTYTIKGNARFEIVATCP